MEAMRCPKAGRCGIDELLIAAIFVFGGSTHGLINHSRQELVLSVVAGESATGAS